MADPLRAEMAGGDRAQLGVTSGMSASSALVPLLPGPQVLGDLGG
jgi:hypothetical protein